MSRAGVPNCGTECPMIWGGADVIIIEIKGTINVRLLNHPETTLPHSALLGGCIPGHPAPLPGPAETLSSPKLVPGAKVVGVAAPEHVSAGSSASVLIQSCKPLGGSTGGEGVDSKELQMEGSRASLCVPSSTTTIPGSTPLLEWWSKGQTWRCSLPSSLYHTPAQTLAHLAISSSTTLFSFCLQSFPASGSFSMSWLFTSGGQSIGASASVSALPMNIQDWITRTYLIPYTSWIR